VKYVQPWGNADPNAPYINGDSSIGLVGSIPSAAAFEHPMREVVHMIDKCKLTPTDLDLYQLLKAIRTNYVNWAFDTGTANSLKCALDPPLEAYNNGLVIRIKVAHTNTGASKIDCGPGERSIVRIDGTPLKAGDMPVGGIACLCYVDTVFQLLNPSIANAGTITGVTGGGDTVHYITNQFDGITAMVAWDTPGTYDWTVPDGVLRVHVRLWGGGGPGIEWESSCPPVYGLYIKGGDGGYVEVVIPVVPKTVMRIVVGAGAAPPAPNPGLGKMLNYNSTNWKNTFGQTSTFGIAGQAPICTASGGRGCWINPPNAPDPAPGENGKGTGGVINRSNGIYGRGGGAYQPSDGVLDDFIECTGSPGACIVMY
jgi:hypothetical protein